MTSGQIHTLIRLIRNVVGNDGRGAATEVQLWHRFTAQRDQTAFTALVERHAPMVLGVCGRILSDPNDVEDAFQATFLVLVRKAASITRPHLLANWLYGVARRTALEAKTRRARRHARERQIIDMPAAVGTDAVVWSDLRPVLDEEVARLPERFRVPFVLCYLEGRTNEEAARLIGCPKGTVLSRLATARERLRTRLTRRGLAPSAALLATLLTSSALRAHAPFKLVRAAIEGALTYISPTAATGAVAVGVVSLANGVVNHMVWTKIYYAAGLLLLLGLAGTAGVSAWGRTGRTEDGPQAQVEAKEPAKAQPSPKPEKKDKADVKIVDVGKPQAREIIDQEEFTGRTEAISTIEVRARITGTLTIVHVKQGTEVKKGEMLFEIDAPSYVAEIQKSQAILAQNAARLERATAALERVRSLLAKGVSSQEEFKQAAGDVAEAKAGVQVAEASIRIGKLNMEFTLVRAPASGVIGRLPIDAGSLVKANETLLATIVKRDPMGVAFDIDQTTALRLRRALAASKPKAKEWASIPVAMRLSDEQGFPRIGKIDSTDSGLNPATEALHVRAVFPNPDGLLLSGLFCRVRLTLGEPHQGLQVPLRAVFVEQGQQFVFVVNSKDVLERREAQGFQQIANNSLVMTRGLNPGDWVILDGGDARKGYRPGMTVQPRRVAVVEESRP